MNIESGSLALLVAVFSMILYGKALQKDERNSRKGIATYYNLLSLIAIAIIFFLIGTFAVA